MAMETYEIGGTPDEECCASTGKTKDAQRYNKLECKAYILALTRVYGEPPEGSRYRTKGNPHDFGTYYEVAFTFDNENQAHRDYANKVEGGLRRWTDANMTAPVLYDDDAQPLHVIEDVNQLTFDAILATVRERSAAGGEQPSA